MEKNKKKRTWSELSRDIFIPLIPPAVVASIVAPIAIVYNNKGGEVTEETWTVTFDDCAPVAEKSFTSKVSIKKGETALPHQPKRIGNYAFLGWKTVKNDGSEEATKTEFFDFDTAITSNTTLYGWWTTDGVANDVTSDPTSTKEPLLYAIDSETGICSIGLNASYLTEHDNYPEAIIVPAQITTQNGETINVQAIDDNGFAHNSLNFDVKTISLPNSIVTIGSYAFQNNGNLQYINIPSNLISTNSYMFLDCCNLKKIELNEGLININYYTFADKSVTYSTGKTHIREITIPSTVEWIGYDAFKSSHIEKVDLSKSKVTRLYWTFEYAYSLREVKLPETLIYLDEGAFFGCCSLEKIELPSHLKTIGDYCFEDCSALKEIKIPASVISIGKEAFSCYYTYYMSLSNVEFEKNSKLQSIGQAAFYYCYNLEKISLPAYVKYLGMECFGASGIKSMNFEGKNIWCFNDGTKWTPTDDLYENSKVIIEELDQNGSEIKGYTDTELGLTYITGEDNRCLITEMIPDDNGKVTIPATITNSEGVEYQVVGIDTSNYWSTDEGEINQEKLVEINFGTTVEGKNINYLEYITDKSFAGCNNLGKVNFEDLANLNYIGSNAFYNCFLTTESSPSLISIDLSNTSVEWIDPYAFWVDEGNTSIIENVILPETLVSLGAGAFWGCNNLKKLDFTKCTNLSNWEYDDDDYFYPIIYNSKIEEIDLSNTALTYIPYVCFEDCTALKNISLPKNIYYFGNKSFMNTSITTFKIPSTCMFIGSETFKSCSKLTGVEFEDKESKWILYNDDGELKIDYYDDVTDSAKNKKAFTEDYVDYAWYSDKIIE